MIAQGTTRRGSRCSTAKAFLRPARLRPNLHVLTHAHVTRVLLDGRSKRALGVQYVRDDEARRPRNAYARREVVLAAGAVGSPQLLMLSGVGPADHLRQLDVPVVQDLKVTTHSQ